MGQLFFEQLRLRAQAIDSVLCVGLDPRLPEGLSGEEITAGILDQNARLIDATKEFAVAYKPNIAFYECHGEPGMLALRATLARIPQEIPIILDAKRGDIGPTAEAYAHMAFEEVKADAVTLSPYMGWDSIEPFLRHQDKGVFILCKTSNPGANDLQLLGLGNSVESLYQRVADLTASWGAQCGLVVAGNDVFALQTIRKRHDKIWFLAPGIGTQGGTITEAVQAGLASDGWGILPVVARSIAQASDPRQAALDLVLEFRQARDAVMAERSQNLSESDHHDHGTINWGVEARAGRGRNEPAYAELKDRVLRGMIANGCFKTGEFKLKSGEISPFYVDLRRIMSDPQLMRDVGLAYASLLGPGSALSTVKFARIAGIPVAALPLATATSLATGVPMIFPRMQAKTHGTGLNVEGEFIPGEETLLLDDLITTGKSKLEAFEILKQAGLSVRHLAVLLERGSQGRRDMEAAGITLHAFAHISEFLPLCQDMGLITVAERKHLETYALA